MTRHPVAGFGSVRPRAAGRMQQPVYRTFLAGAVLVSVACSRQPVPVRAAVVDATPVRTESEIRELDIAWFTARAERDPTGAADLAHLGALYLERGRETGDPRDALRAEEVARRSLRHRATHNAAAASVLQGSLLAQHRFSEALVLARAALEMEPEHAGLRAAVGEIQMELGQYDEARASFTGLHATAGDLAVAPRLARWMEIEGQPDRARRLVRSALAAAEQQPALTRAQLAWYHLRVGDVELHAGHPVAADSAYRKGLAIHPDDHRLLAALARVALVQQRWRDAADFGERAIALSLDPATLGTLSDAYAALGDTAHSEEYARALDVAVVQQPGAYHRAWSLFLLDHDRHVERVARKVRNELRARTDVYGYDLLAWSLHAQGRDREAASAMEHAMAQGTLDAQLFFHAGMIRRALGDTAEARVMLEHAIATNPYFHYRQPAIARAVLDSLRAGVAPMVLARNVR
jgi:tetratricopeptide (TPR) repeat protein